jgi:Fe-S cluster assembly ATPase SufC
MYSLEKGFVYVLKGINGFGKMTITFTVKGRVK